MAEEKQTTKATVASHSKAANIVVIVVASIAAFILILIAVLSAVSADPIDKIATPDCYDIYDLDKTTVEPMTEATQQKMSVALEDMDFSVMSGILQGYWDYTYNFLRDEDGNKQELSASGVSAIKSSSTEYMIVFVYKTVAVDRGVIDYSTAQSLEVDGETVYFDRLKVLIGDSGDRIGSITIYPYLSVRLNNVTDDEEFSSDTYKTCGFTVRANTGSTFVQIGKIIEELKQ